MTDPQWADFLAGQDPVWRRLPTKWSQGPFLGDGRLGSMVYAVGNRIKFTVQHAEVQDHRATGGSAWGVPRLPVGHVLLTPVGTVRAVDWRLDLWHAELVGTLTTDRGALRLHAIITDGVLGLSVTPSGDERVDLVFVPEKAIPPRAATEAPPSGYEFNPDPVTKTSGSERVVVQSLVAGGQTATAYRVTGTTGKRRLLLSVAHSFPATTAEASALARVRAAAALPGADFQQRHRDWWHAFYRRSFLSFPDQRLQSFYWIQLYKLAAGTRAGGPVMATCGPWLEPTPWAAAWWNLNVQLEYWPIHGSNHLELDAVATTLKDNAAQLVRNVKSQYRDDCAGVGRSTDQHTSNTGTLGEPGGTGTIELGNLTWALHNVWLSYRHSMDRTLLADVVFPLLRRAVNYYLRFLTKGNDGRLHLPATTSPEYGNAPDCNYDLQLLRWACRTLLDSARVLRIDDPLAKRWQEVLDTLVPYPVDDNGFMVGTGVPFAKSHRHYSHMLAVFPLATVNWDQPENRALIEKSLRHWMSLEGAHRGYSYSGSGSIAARMFRGDDALAYLVRMFSSTRYPVLENTMYAEAGPVVETPLSAAQTLHDLVLQSWGGVVRVFPAVPTAWADVVLDRHLAEGAFEVTAVRRAGRTRFVLVRSLAGEPLVLRHGVAGDVVVRTPDGSPVPHRDRGDGTLDITLPRGGEVLVHPAGVTPDLSLAPVPVSNPGPRWGLP
ncbi:MAG: Tat pathway signal sequence domain protein [Saccharothrix sp.]|nr:Tat pathway signal sequence domain protein [Saccharothrix sp.]